MCFCSYILGWRAAVTAGAKENSQDCDTNIFECDLIYFSLKYIFSLLKVQRITGSCKGQRSNDDYHTLACRGPEHAHFFLTWAPFPASLCAPTLEKCLFKSLWERGCWLWCEVDRAGSGCDFLFYECTPHSEPLFLPACGTAPVLLPQLYQTPQCRARIQPRHTYYTPSSLNSRFQFVDFGVTLIQISSRKV